jgi:hypothetical protein
MYPNGLIGAYQEASVVVDIECKAKPIHELETPVVVTLQDT